MLRYGLATLGIVALGAGIALVRPAAAGTESPKIQATAHLYDTYCAQCHGVQRNGKGVNTVGLSVQPRDHSDTVAMSSLPREQIVKAITDGGASVNKSALMPSWSGVLSKDQIEDMADYLMYVCKCNKGS
ncbi:c-type cytochrome [Rhizorhabdus wittichii]|uniref:Cytochrome c n=1 Tax=Rhizorhabdus wittichii TaxID=160791 RepID=A0A975D4A1_9SPHN|nr:cytochrome c [Rhizorhabdus wittichii]QTH21415.1 cytochrome c [Rhizorhabdus wittichii]